MFGLNPYLIIWIVTFLFFERTLCCKYVVDDDVMYYSMKKQKEIKKKSITQWITFVRTACYGAGFFKNSTQEHLATIILHGINCSLIYMASGSLIGAVLYCINPINNQTAIWLNGRRYALTIMFVLLAWNFWPIAIPCLAFAGFIHASGFPAPLLWMFTPMWPVSFLTGGAMALCGLDYQIKIANGRKQDFTKENESQRLTPKKIILYVKTVGYHFFNCLFPVSPSMYNDFLVDFGVTKEATRKGYKINFEFLKGVIAIGLICFLLTTEYSFWAFWFILFISMWGNIYQVTMPASDRYCSLANVGLMVIVGKIISSLPPEYGNAAFAAIAVFYSAKYFPMFRAYMNVESFYKYHVNLNPRISKPRFFLSKFYIAKKDPYSAFAIVKEGLRYNPEDSGLLLCCVENMFALGRRTDALKIIDMIESKNLINDAEKEECLKLFAGIKDQFKKEYELLHGKVNGKTYIHNGGSPIINK